MVRGKNPDLIKIAASECFIWDEKHESSRFSSTFGIRVVGFFASVL